jgi:hypothetical protein
MKLVELLTEAPEQTFTFLGKSWNIDAAIEMIKAQNIPSEEFAVSDLASLLGLVRVDKKHATNADLSNPVILATLKEGLMLIDGYHRVTKAKNDGIEKLSGYVLDEEQSRSIELP